MEIGIDSFVSEVTDPRTGVAYSSTERMRQFLAEVVAADRAGVDTFGSASTIGRTTSTPRRW